MQRRSNGGAGIDDLVLPDQGGQRQIQQPLGALEHQAAALLERLVSPRPRPSAARHSVGRLARMASSASGGCCEITARTPGLRMPAFSRAICCDRRTELVGVIHRDRA